MSEYQQKQLEGGWQPLIDGEYHEAVVDAADRVENTTYLDDVPIEISYIDIEDYDEDFAHDLLNAPKQLIDAALAVIADHDAFETTDSSDVTLQFTDIPSTSVRDITYEHLNRLIAVEGVVQQATDPQPRFTELAFECQRCGTLTPISQPADKLIEPHECKGCERQGPFRTATAQSTYVHHQQIRIQESPEGLRGGQDPRSLDIHIEGDNVDEATPGDQVTATGILTHPDPVSDDTDSPRVTPYLEQNAVDTESSAFTTDNITDEEAKQIKAIAARDDTSEAIVQSIAPTIYGNKMEKLAVALQMFSGVQKQVEDKTIRGDMHVFLVGDPGTAKSQLLHFANDIMPRSSFSTGEGSSKAGLTGAAVQSDLGDGAWSIEAGVLVLADTGIACVDELDKLDEGTDALHSALEQQEVSIAKAGISTTMNARCGLLAAANPKYGRWDDFEPVTEQVDLPPALVSRFDLIFTLKDQPDREFDSKLAESILNTNQAGQKISSGEAPEDVDELQEPEFPLDLLPKYIMYARNNVDPVMTADGKKALKEFYVDMRSKGVEEGNAVPVTARKLEALVRLAEASARMRLSDEITELDTDLAIETVKMSLEQVGIDPETGEFDADMVEAGTSKTQRDRVKTLKDLINDMEEDYDDGVPYEDAQEAAEEEKGIDERKFEHEIEKLKQKGEIYEPKTGHLRTT